MKITIKRFTVPACVFIEPMPAKIRCLLIYLFSVSRYGGECRPGYSAMKEALRNEEGERGSDATIRRALEMLKKRGWIFHTKRTQTRMAIFLQIPFRFRVEKATKDALSVLPP